MSKEFKPNKGQAEAFKKVIDAMKAAKKKGLCFYGRQESLVAYTNKASSYIDKIGFDESLEATPFGQVHNLSYPILDDSGADDCPYYQKYEDNPDNA